MRLSVGLIALVVAAAPLRAQGIPLSVSTDTLPSSVAATSASSAVPADTAADTEAAVAMSRAGLQSGVHVREKVHADHAVLASQRAGLGRPMAMMIVGGAALIAGAIISGTPGTIVMLGGAAVGLYGLYQYLQYLQ